MACGEIYCTLVNEFDLRAFILLTASAGRYGGADIEAPYRILAFTCSCARTFGPTGEWLRVDS